MKLLSKYDLVEIAIIVFLFIVGLLMVVALFGLIVQIARPISPGCVPYATL